MQRTTAEILALIDAARSGSSSKLGALLEHFRPQLLKQAKRSIGKLLGRRMSISDLVQETMVTASSQFQSFRGQSEHELAGWLQEMLRSRLVDGIRRHRLAERRRISREVPSTGSKLVDDNPTADQLVAAVDQANELLKALQELPADLQEIVRLRYLENRTFESIAGSLNIPLSTVWRRWMDALEKLKHRLQ